MKNQDSVIIEKVQKIMALSVQVSSETEHDVFVRYSGHISSIDAQYMDGGWTARKDFVNLGSNENPSGIIRLWDENIPLLDSVIEHLEQLLCPTK